LSQAGIVLTRAEEGSNLVSNLASNNALKDVVERDNLVEFVVKNPCQKGKPQRTTLASTTEAIVGAVWYDCGKDFETVEGGGYSD
jgi:ribonuclease-3